MMTSVADRRGPPRHAWTTVLLVAMLVLAGCDAEDSSEPLPNRGSPAPTPTVTVPGADDIVRLTVVINAGRVTPSNVPLTARPDQSILLTVSSDAKDELQVNSDPPQTFQVSAAEGQGYGFTTGGAGQFTVRLRELNQTIATIDSRAN